ncbi:hypothetical protein E2C01_002297 [Portunus trituberculatus]|uniref:Uncharacterized protein n=1 Tax=Portunus trituberculatus TaxID=210409 RepID=A0A5B7CK04_PORTR|nr:hypothetical protein [Portunus trituberculatus]
MTESAEHTAAPRSQLTSDNLKTNTKRREKQDNPVWDSAVPCSSYIYTTHSRTEHAILHELIMAFTSL